MKINNDGNPCPANRNYITEEEISARDYSTNIIKTKEAEFDCFRWRGYVNENNDMVVLQPDAPDWAREAVSNGTIKIVQYPGMWGRDIALMAIKTPLGVRPVFDGDYVIRRTDGGIFPLIQEIVDNCFVCKTI